MPESAAPPPPAAAGPRSDGLRRELGAFDATAVVVGAIVGVGIFFTPSRVAALAGDLALWTWVLAGGIAALGALTFAELGGMLPRTGGQYLLLREAYGPATAFVYVVCNATAIQAGAIAIIALVAVENGAVALGIPPPATGATTALAILLVVLLASANVRGVRSGSRIQNVTTVARLGALAAVIALGLVAAPSRPPSAPGAAPGATVAILGVCAGLVPALFTFGGWQQVLWVAGEVRDPERNVPRATLLGVAVVVLCYLGTNWVYLALLGADGVAASRTLAADAMAVVSPRHGARLVAGAVAISALGVLNAQLLTGPRLVFALARDRWFFAPFARVHARFGTPAAAVALLAGTAILLLVAAGARGLDRLLTGVVLVDGCFFALTGAASLVLLRRYPRVARPIRMPWFPWVPLAFTACELAVVVGAWLDPEVRSAAFVGLAWMTGAWVLFLVRFRGRGTPPAGVLSDDARAD